MDNPLDNLPDLNQGFTPQDSHNHDGVNSPQINYADIKDKPSGSGSKVRVHLGTNTTVIGAQQISFDTVDFATNSEFDTTSHQFTAKTAGYYQIYASLYFSGSVTNYQYATKIYKNNAEVSESNKIRVNSSDDPFTIGVSDLVYLAAGDHLDIYGYTNAASNVTINNGATITYLTIYSI